MVAEFFKSVGLPPPKVPEIKMARSNLRLLAYTFFYIVFIILGAAIFSAIEAPDEMVRIRDLRKRRQKFLEDHPCVVGK